MTCCVVTGMPRSSPRRSCASATRCSECAALPPELLYAIVVIAFLYLLTAGSWMLIVAALVKTTRAGQQIAGLLIGISVALFAGLAAAAAQVGDGWPLLVLGVALVAADVVALFVARRVWQREEVLARL